MRFSDLIGQEEVKATFLRAVREDRVSHAQLLSGPGGVGKLAFALAAVQYLNCADRTESDSCGVCSSCVKTAKMAHPDLHIVFPIFSKTTGGQAVGSEEFLADFRKQFLDDPYLSLPVWNAAISPDNKQLAIPIHEMRNLKRKLSLVAFEGRYKAAILWHAEKINTEAANAFLKLLEEPPDATILFLTAESGARLLSTITSRCQTMRFKRLSTEHIESYLVEQVGAERAAARDAALLSDGGLARAIEVFREMRAPEKEKDDKKTAFAPLFMQFMRTAYTGVFKDMQPQARALSKQSREYQKLFIEYCLQKTRDSALIRFDQSEFALATANEKAFLANFTKVLDVDKLKEMQTLLEQSYYYVARNGNGEMIFLILLIRLHHIFRN